MRQYPKNRQRAGHPGELLADVLAIDPAYESTRTAAQNRRAVTLSQAGTVRMHKGGRDSRPAASSESQQWKRGNSR